MPHRADDAPAMPAMHTGCRYLMRHSFCSYAFPPTWLTGEGMNTVAYFSAPKTLRRIHAGPLGPYVDEFASWLQEQHYSRSSGQTSVRAVANWSRWLQVRHIAARDIDAKLLDRYFLYVARAGSLGPDDRRALQKMLTWLQKIGVASATCFSSPVNQRKTVGDDFEQYMLQQCGLSPVTLRLYLPFISLFLRQRFGEGPIKLETLVAHDITAFVQRNCRSLGPQQCSAPRDCTPCVFAILAPYGKDFDRPCGMRASGCELVFLDIAQGSAARSS